MNGRTEAEQMAAEHEAANPPVRLTDDERRAIQEGADALYGIGSDYESETLRRLLARSQD